MSVRRTLTLATLALLAVAPAQAQSPGNPFAGRPAGGLGPYGNDAGATLHLMQAAPAVRVAPTGAVASTVTGAAREEPRETPHRVETREGSPWFEAMFVGCAAGAFLGGYTAWSTAAPAVGAELAVMGAPAAGYAMAALGTATAIGCGLGASTATVSVAAAAVWSWAFK